MHKRSLILLCALVAACGRGAPPAREDSAAGVPARVVTLGPSVTEIAWVLGAADRLVGRSRWDGQPPAVRAVPDVGDAIRPSVERIIATRPDLVVMYPAGDNAPAMEALTRAGIRTLALRVDRIADFLRAVDTLGTLLGEPARADSIARAIRAQLDAVRAAVPEGERPTVFVPVWGEPLMTVGDGSFLSELIAIAGGRNVYADRAEPAFTVSLEDVVRRDPSLILAAPSRDSVASSRASWRRVRAAREGRIVALDTTLMSQPSTRLGEAARVLAERIRALRP